MILGRQKQADGTVETWHEDGDKLVQQRTFDLQPVLDHTAALRETGSSSNADWWHLGTIDGRMLSAWLKEAGVDWSDTEGMQTVINRKLMDGEFAKFRVKEGTF